MATEQHRCDDATLVRAAQGGDREAFGELFRRHHADVRRACASRMGSCVEGDEVAQAAFVRAYERIDRCRGDRRFGPWVRMIALRLCADTWRSRSRTTPVDQPLGSAAAGPDDCEEELLRRERADTVQRALFALPSRQRNVIVARDLEGRRPGEIAATLAISLGAVDSLLLRARRGLAAAYRGILSEQGAVSTSVTTATVGATSAASPGTPVGRALRSVSRALDTAALHVAGALGAGPAGPTVAQRVARVAVAAAVSAGPALAAPGPAAQAPQRRPLTALVEPVVAGAIAVPGVAVLAPVAPPSSLAAAVGESLPTSLPPLPAEPALPAPPAVAVPLPPHDDSPVVDVLVVVEPAGLGPVAADAIEVVADATSAVVGDVTGLLDLLG